MAQGDLKVGVDFNEVEKAAQAVEKIGTNAKKAKSETKDLSSTLGGFRSAGGPIGDVASKFEDMKDRVSGATDGLRGLSTGLGSTAAAAGVAVVALAALAAVAVATGVVKLALDIADTADALNDMANRTNISTERLSLYDAMAKMAGSSVEELVGSAEKLGLKLAKQDEETGKVVKGLDSLGISTKDVNGETKSMLELQEEVVLAVDKAANKAAAEGAALQVLGTEYYKIRTAVRETHEQKKEMYDYMANVGAVVTTKLAKDSDALNDNIAKLGLSFKGMANSIAGAAIPYLNALLEKMIGVGEYAAMLVRRWSGNSTSSETTGDGLSKLKADYANAQAAIAKIEGTEYAKSGGGDKELRNQRDRVNMLGEQIREMNKYKSSADAAAASVKKAVTEGAVGEGNRPSGKTGAPKKEKAEKKDNSAEKEANEQLKLMERFASLGQKQVDTLEKALGIDSERNRIQREGMEILAGVKGLTGEQRELAVQTLLAQYDKTKAAEKEKKTQEEITKEKSKQLDAVNELILKSNEYIAKQQGEFSDRFLSKIERAANESERGATGGYDAAIAKAEQQMRTDLTLTDEKREGMRQFIDQMRVARGEALGAIQALNAEKANAEGSLTEGLSRGFRAYADSIPTIAQQTADAVTSISQSMEDAFVQFSTTGKFSIKDLARTVIAEFARMQAKAAVSGLMKFLGGAISGYSGSGEVGITGSTLSFGSGSSNLGFGGKYANGGNPPVGKVSLVGERGPELFIPKSQGTIVPNHAMGGSSLSQTISFGDIIVQGGNTNEETAAALRRELVPIMQGIAKKTLMDEKRPGGLLRAY